jgi:hypothetical protein
MPFIEFHQCYLLPTSGCLSIWPKKACARWSLPTCSDSTRTNNRCVQSVKQPCTGIWCCDNCWDNISTSC